MVHDTVVDHSPPQTPQVKPSVAQNGTSRSEASQTRPGNSRLGGTTGQKWIEPVGFGCGKIGHIQENCLDKRQSHALQQQHIYTHIQIEADTWRTGNVVPTDDTQEGETPPEDEDTKREYIFLTW